MEAPGNGLLASLISYCKVFANRPFAVALRVNSVALYHEAKRVKLKK